jgi:hypothetical protein
MEAQYLNDHSKVVAYLTELKTLMPEAEHGALESRMAELLNDASADDFDVISMLSQEFDPQTRVDGEKYR